jgi:hypothetical protein
MTTKKNIVKHVPNKTRINGSEPSPRTKAKPGTEGKIKRKKDSKSVL